MRLRRVHLLLVLVLALGVPGCINSLRSVSPPFEPGDLRREPSLTGVWGPAGVPSDSEASSIDSWTFKERDDGSFDLRLTGRGAREALFDASVFSLGRSRFLALYPSERAMSTVMDSLVRVDATAYALAPTWLVLRLEGVDSTLRLSLVEDEALDRYLQKHPKVKVGRTGGPFFMGRTSEVRDALLWLEREPRAWSEEPLRRTRQGQP